MTGFATWVLAAWIVLASPALALADAAAGKALFDAKGCAGCHAINGEGGAIGPDLTAAGSVPGHDRGWQVRHLLDPASVVPGSIMPALADNEVEAGQLTDYILTLTGAPAPAVAAPAVADVAAPAVIHVPAAQVSEPETKPEAEPERVAPPVADTTPMGIPNPVAGMALYAAKGCDECHTIYGQGGDQGPDLSAAGAVPGRNVQWQIDHLIDPMSKVPGSTMPAQMLDRLEATHLAAYLMTLMEPLGGTPTASPAPMAASPARGQKIFVKKGCGGCHAIRSTGGTLGPDLTFQGEIEGHDADWHARHLANPRAASPGSVMPKFKLPRQDRDDLIAYLLSLVHLEADRSLMGPLATRFAALSPALEIIKDRVALARENGRNVDDYTVRLSQAWTHVGAVEEMIRKQSVIDAEPELASAEALANALEVELMAFELSLEQRFYMTGLMLLLLALGCWLLIKKINLLTGEYYAEQDRKAAEEAKQAERGDLADTDSTP